MDFSVSEIPRLTDTMGKNNFVYDSYRTSHVMFKIATHTQPQGNYVIGLRNATNDPPTQTDLRSAPEALTRNLSNEFVNIYLAVHIDGEYFDTGASKNWAEMENTILIPNTEYTIYVTSSDQTGEVFSVMNIKTDPEPIGIVSNDTHYGTIYNDNTTIFPSKDTDPLIFYLKVIQPTTANAIAILRNGEEHTTLNADITFATGFPVGATEKILLGKLSGINTAAISGISFGGESSINFSATTTVQEAKGINFTKAE